MKSSQDDKFASLAVPPASLVPNSITPELRSFLDGNPQGVVVIVYMKPERVHGFGELMKPERVHGFPEAIKEEAIGAAPVAVRPKDEIRKEYRAGSWFFAADLIDRLAEVATSECSGFRVRPVAVEVTFELDRKAYNHRDQIGDSFDDAYRGL